MVTDYDCWREGEEAVEVAGDRRPARTPMPARRGALVVELAKALPTERAPSPIDTDLDSAIITAPEARDPAMLAKLDAVCRPASSRARASSPPDRPPASRTPRPDPAAGDQLLAARHRQAGMAGIRVAAAVRPGVAEQEGVAGPRPSASAPVFANKVSPPS